MKAPRMPSVFKLTEHNRYKRFAYEPRTFDERKERLEKRRREIEKELELEKRMSEKHESHLRELISESWPRREMRRQNRNSGIRLLLILAALIILIYLIYANLELTF